MTIDGIPDEIWGKIPNAFRNSIYRGELPDPGLGIIGPSGSKKSGTLVWASEDLYVHAAQRLAGTCLANSCSQTYLQDPPIKVVWVDWPKRYGWLQRHAVETEQIDNWLHQVIHADVVILDDLGAESSTWRGANDISTPFALGRLAEVIRSRNANCGATWWTSNLSGKDFKNIYEISILSRLYELAPPLIVPATVPNFRLPIVSTTIEKSKSCPLSPGRP